MSAIFAELTETALVSFRGPEAVSFLHGQLTSDVAGIASPGTQYSGYCSPKGRLIATFIVWRSSEEVLLQLPAELREDTQKRLSRYVLRAKLAIADAAPRYALFGIAGRGAANLLLARLGKVPDRPHAIVSRDALAATCLPGGRYLLLVERQAHAALRAELAERALQQSESAWHLLDIEAGVPTITRASQEQYVPQMVNLDLIGGVSYTKGCYPGQEIVARTHYLGRLKQRLYRVRIIADRAPVVGDPLYSREFGPEQASGAVLNVAPAADGGYEALAVIQTSSVAGGRLHFGSLDGPPLSLLPLPYAVPA